jgi:hypothetical protein
MRLVKNQEEMAFKALGKTVSKTVKACSHHKPDKGCMVEPQATVHCAERGIIDVTGHEFAFVGDYDSRDQFRGMVLIKRGGLCQHVP